MFSRSFLRIGGATARRGLALGVGAGFTALAFNQFQTQTLCAPVTEDEKLPEALLKSFTAQKADTAAVTAKLEN
jgi:tetrahydromethanopterin S-methyltransferase subunit D